MTKPAGKSILVAVDRVEGSIAVMQADDGREFSVPAKSLGSKPTEGLIYRVPVRADGKPQWSKAIADPAAAEARRKDLDGRMSSMRQKDPSGDLEL
jgi:hypothetical protein